MMIIEDLDLNDPLCKDISDIVNRTEKTKLGIIAVEAEKKLGERLKEYETMNGDEKTKCGERIEILNYFLEDLKDEGSH